MTRPRGYSASSDDSSGTAREQVRLRRGAADKRECEALMHACNLCRSSEACTTTWPRSYYWARADPESECLTNDEWSRRNEERKTSKERTKKREDRRREGEKGSRR